MRFFVDILMARDGYLFCLISVYHPFRCPWKYRSDDATKGNKLHFSFHIHKRQLPKQKLSAIVGFLYVGCCFDFFCVLPFVFVKSVRTHHIRFIIMIMSINSRDTTRTIFTKARYPQKGHWKQNQFEWALIRSLCVFSTAIWRSFGCTNSNP